MIIAITIICITIWGDLRSDAKQPGFPPGPLSALLRPTSGIGLALRKKERRSRSFSSGGRDRHTHGNTYTYHYMYMCVCIYIYIYIYIYNIAIHTYIYIYTYTHRSEQGPADLGLQHHALRVDLRGVLDLSHYALLGWLVVLLCLLLSLVLYCNHIRVLVCI